MKIIETHVGGIPHVGGNVWDVFPCVNATPAKKPIETYDSYERASREARSLLEVHGVSMVKVKGRSGKVTYFSKV